MGIFKGNFVFKGNSNLIHFNISNILYLVKTAYKIYLG